MYFIHTTVLQMFLLLLAVIPKITQLSPVAKNVSVKFRKAKIRIFFSQKKERANTPPNIPAAPCHPTFCSVRNRALSAFCLLCN